jgi:hypothetical protein
MGVAIVGFGFYGKGAHYDVFDGKGVAIIEDQ